jgi:hypothetical protein
MFETRLHVVGCNFDEILRRHVFRRVLQYTGFYSFCNFEASQNQV